MDQSVIGILLLILTGLITYKGFRDSGFFEEHVFDVDGILVDGQYKRLVSSGFLHANWLHFGFNMAALLSFSLAIEEEFGYGKFLLFYFACLLGGSLLALYIHRHHGDYRAVGASGAISGVIFSYIVLYPASKIGFVILPFEFPSWLFGFLFILISIFGIKSQKGNIGHEAHLGGAITGVLLTVLLSFFLPLGRNGVNWLVVAAILVPTVAFLLLIARNPAVLMIDHYWGETVDPLIHKKQLLTRREKQEELDRLLDKIRRQGIGSLSKKERRRLEELTGEL